METSPGLFCVHCQTTKPLDDYSASNRRPGGWCRACRNIYIRDRRKAQKRRLIELEAENTRLRQALTQK